MANWMIYGATGYTGQLVAEEAVKRGHKPILAGRSESKLKPLAERLGLEYVAFRLTDTFTVIGALREAGVQLVYHAAGPFIETSDVMIKGCLAVGAHYLDITGEIPVYQNAFSYDAAARDKGIAILPGVGFDVIPSDCLIRYVADQLPPADDKRGWWLEVVVDAFSGTQSDGSNIGVSAGTTNSMLAMMPTVGNVVRRAGELVPVDFGSGARAFRMPTGNCLAMPAPWGDVEMAYHTTGIPNITANLVLPQQMIRASQYGGALMSQVLKITPLRRAMQAQVNRLLTGPTLEQRAAGRAYVYARVTNAQGRAAEAWLETVEAYEFTKTAAVRVVEQVLDSNLRGALSPAAALGADFVLGIAGTKRYDTLPPTS